MSELNLKGKDVAKTSEDIETSKDYAKLELACLNVLKPNFSRKDFISLLLVKLLENGINKIDTMELKYILAPYYKKEEYKCLFEDLSLKEQAEGSFVELDEALLFAQFLGMLSEQVNGTNIRIIWWKEVGELFNYSAEYVSKMDKLVSDLKSLLDKNNTPIKRIKWIQYNQKMTSRKEELEKELEDINKQLNSQRKVCDHIMVCLGWDGQFQYRDTSYCTCLLCGDYFSYSKYKEIDASYYKEELYSHGELSSYRKQRLIDLQNLAISLMTENSCLTQEELVEMMIQIISEEKGQLKENQGTVKKLVPNRKEKL